MYLHCHDCDWQQDDFYSESYNPAKYLMSWNDNLIGERSSNIDKRFSGDPEFLRQNGPISTREVLAREYESAAKNIRNMKWLTYEQWENEKPENKVCPECGSENLDID